MRMSIFDFIYTKDHARKDSENSNFISRGMLGADLGFNPLYN